MRRLRAWLLRLGEFFHQEGRDREFDDEIQSHLEFHIEDNLRSGMTPDEARKNAIIKLGGIEQTKQKYRERRGLPELDSFLKDLRYGLRQLRKSPGFVLVAVLTLALGIGATTAIFSVVHAVLLRPLPYRQPEQIVTIWQNNVKAGVTRNEVSPANFLDWREQSQSFETISGIEPFGFAIVDNGEPERFAAALVSSGFFETLGAKALRGRTFSPEEYKPGNDRVVVLSYGLWQRRFGGNPELLGRTLTLNRQPYTVVGIMPREVQFPLEREIWAPLITNDHDREIRGPTYWNVIARLKPGITIGQAQQEMSSISARLERQYPDTNGGMGATVVSLPELLTGQARSALLILLGAVLFVLLIACANVANLLLVRGAQRQREFAIRSALGAERIRIVRQLLTESLMLAFLGGAGGLLVARWGIALILSTNSTQIFRLEYVSMDTPVLLFVCAISMLTTILFGLIPAAQFWRQHKPSDRNQNVRGAAASLIRPGLRNSLVVAEVALALALLTGAGLLVRSFVNLLLVNPGFSQERVLALQVFLARNYEDPQKIVRFFDNALEKIGAVPGVKAAAVVASPPFIHLEFDVPFTVSGSPASPPGKEPSAYNSEVSPDYLKVMRIPLRSGRFFTKFDMPKTTPVVVINETMARRYFPNQDPVGKKVTAIYEQPVQLEVVGVVGDVLHSGLDTEPRPEMFVPYSQSPSPQMTFVVRTAADPVQILPAVKAAIREVNRTQTFSKVSTMEQLVSDSLQQRRFNLFVLGSFAALALALAGIGIYGLISYSAEQRTQEIGVRMALGAQASDVLRLLLIQGMKMTVAGVAIGLTASLLLTRVLKGLLFDVSTTDPITYLAIPLLLIAVALLACWIPARQAMKVDPLVALRYE